MGSWRGKKRPLLVFWPVSMGFNAALQGDLSKNPLDSKRSRFFMRPPHPDDARRRFKIPGEITVANGH